MSVTVAGATTTALTSSVNPTTQGASTTLTATVTGASPTGNVTFRDGGTPIGTVALTAGVASLVVSNLSTTTHSLTAVYEGNANNATSTSSAVSQVVNKASSSTSLSSSVNPSTFGSPTTLTATVTGASPSGTVTFKDGATSLGTGTISGGVATLITSNIAQGTRTLTAEYGGDTNNLASTSSGLAQTVNAAPSGTVLLSSVNPTALGGSTTLTATVTGASPTGTVTFFDGATSLGSNTLSGGSTTLVVSSLSVGSHNLTAVYGGDGNNVTSTSAVVIQTVKSLSSTALTSSVNPTNFGGSTNLTATVTAAGATGSVTFFDGGSAIGTVTLSGGAATLAVSSLSASSHSLTAVYSGDASYASSTSSAVTQVVLGGSSTVLTSSVNPTAVGGSTTLTATVTGASPTGTVTFFDGATSLGSSALSAGSATLAVSSLTVGSHSLTAAYGGDGNNATSTSAAVSQTVNPVAVPTITSPTSGSASSFAVNVASTLQLVATNSATSYAVSPALPAGFRLNTSTGLISILATGPLSSTAYTFTATNGLGTSAGVSLNFSVGSPSPVACAVNTPLNTAQTIDLSACMFGGSTPTGFNMSLAPAHGTATVTGTKVTYTPANNYFGTDSFMVVASFGTVKAPAGTVTITITGRPDPTQDVAVQALVAVQEQAAVRFSQTQVANYGRHLESLRRVGGPTGGQRAGLAGPSGINTAARPLAAPVSTNTSGLPMASAAGLGTPASAALSQPGATQLPVGTAPVALPLNSAVSMAANGLGLGASPLYGLAAGLVQDRSINLGALSKALNGDVAQSSGVPGTKIWVEGVASFGSRDASGGVSASEFSSNGISIGLDYPVSETLTLGVGFGLSKDKTTIGTDGSKNQAQGYSLAAYGSYQPAGSKAFFEAMLGVGSLDFDMVRYVAPVNDFALSSRKGQQVFGSVGAGMEFRNQATMVSPYMRLDFSNDTLREATETGAGSYALTYYEQNSTAAQGVLGLRGEAIHAASFGWAVPRARVEWRQDLRDGSASVISYADQFGGTRYSIAPTDSRRSAMVFGLGSEFMFRDGWSFGVDYQLSRVSDIESSYAIRLKLSKEFGVKGLPDLLQGVEMAFDDDDEITVDSGIAYDDNINRAKEGSGVLSDTAYSLNVSKTRMVFLSSNTRMLFTGIVGGERLQNHNGLSRASIGGEAALQYRGSAEFDAPTWGLLAKVSGEDFQSTLRDGVRYAGGLTVQQPLTDRISLFGALMQNVRRANSDAFNTTDTSLRLNLDYALQGATLYFTGEYRSGDIVSTARPSLENVTIAKVFVQDDAYPGGQLFSYRFPGNTVLATIGYNIGLGARDSLDLSWRRVESTPNERPVWAISPNSYISNQLSANYLMRF